MQSRAMMSLSSGRRREKRKRESPCREGGRVLTRAMSRRREKERDWTLLPEGIVDCIGGLLLEEDVTEYICLRRVCASWRHATPDPVLTDPRFHPRNWMFISRLENHNDFRFLNLSTGKYIRAHVPHDTTNHIFLRAADGLLVFIDGASRVIHLLNPFTGARISLPSLHEVVDRNNRITPPHFKIEHARTTRELVRNVKFTLLSSSSFTVVITFSCALAYAKPGDTEWSFPSAKSQYLIQSFQDQIYSLCADGHILRLDQTGITTVHPSLSLPTSGGEGSYHLVVSDGEMLVVRHYGVGGFWDYQKFMKVFKVDLENGKLIPKNSIGEHALFISVSRGAFSVSTRTFPSIRPGTIFYTTVYTGVYHPIGCACHPQNIECLDAGGPSCWVEVY